MLRASIRRQRREFVFYYYNNSIEGMGVDFVQFNSMDAYYQMLLIECRRMNATLSWRRHTRPKLFSQLNSKNRRM